MVVSSRLIEFVSHHSSARSCSSQAGISDAEVKAPTCCLNSCSRALSLSTASTRAMAMLYSCESLRGVHLAGLLECWFHISFFIFEEIGGRGTNDGLRGKGWRTDGEPRDVSGMGQHCYPYNSAGHSAAYRVANPRGSTTWSRVLVAVFTFAVDPFLERRKHLGTGSSVPLASATYPRVIRRRVA